LLPVDISEVIILANGIILGFAVIDAVTEALPNNARVLIPFRKNALTRILALCFAPGWIGGLGFFCLAFAFWIAGFGLLDHFKGTGSSNTEDWVSLVSGPNLLIFPLVIIHLFFYRQLSSQFIFGMYTFIQVCLLAISMLVLVMAGTLRVYEEIIYAIVPLPSLLLFAAAEGEAGKPHFFFIAIATTAICLLIPCLRSRAHYRDFFRNLK